jgi:hypothetical protein
MYIVKNIYKNGKDKDGYCFFDKCENHRNGYEIHFYKDNDLVEIFFMNTTQVAQLKDTEKKINTAIKTLELAARFENLVQPKIIERLKNLYIKKEIVHNLNKAISPEEQFDEYYSESKKKIITINDDKLEFTGRK